MLTERQLEIVLALVYEYIQTGEPVGSRTLSRKYLTEHSPATVRNEMSDLEEMGFFSKPHSSAGRLPTALAYRLYVDAILHRPTPEATGLGDLMRGLDLHLKGLDERLRDVSRFLSRLTHCLSLAAVKVLDELRVQKVDFIPLAGSAMLIILVVDDGTVRHCQFSSLYALEPVAWAELADAVNHLVIGRPWADVRKALRPFMALRLEHERVSFADGLDRLEALLERERLIVSAGGASNILLSGEDSRMENPQGILGLLEEGGAVDGFITDYAAPHGIRVTIGPESRDGIMKDCSVVMASSSEHGRQAVLGLIGPLRMNYQRSIAILDAVLATLDGRG